MTRSRQNSRPNGQTSANAGGQVSVAAKSKSAKSASGKSGSAKKDGSPANKDDTADRPGASGHRFGPDLACSECGINWDVHQREPKPCKTEAVAAVFTRRPANDFQENSAVSGKLSDAPPPTPTETPTSAATRVPASAVPSSPASPPATGSEAARSGLAADSTVEADAEVAKPAKED